MFTNVARGLLASKNDLMRGFDTTDTISICKEILEKGEFQISELERKALYDGLVRDVASIGNSVLLHFIWSSIIM